MKEALWVVFCLVLLTIAVTAWICFFCALIVDPYYLEPACLICVLLGIVGLLASGVCIGCIREVRNE